MEVESKHAYPAVAQVSIRMRVPIPGGPTYPCTAAHYPVQKVPAFPTCDLGESGAVTYRQ